MPVIIETTSATLSSVTVYRFDFVSVSQMALACSSSSSKCFSVSRSLAASSYFWLRTTLFFSTFICSIFDKNKVVRSQKYEEAAKLRDTEKHLLEELEQAKAIWETETKSKRYTVTEDNVAEVVSMMTG